MTECGPVLLTHPSGKREQTRCWGYLNYSQSSVCKISCLKTCYFFLTEGIRKLFSGASMAASRGAMVTVGQVKQKLFSFYSHNFRQSLNGLSFCHDQDSLSSSLVFLWFFQLSCYDQAKQLVLGTGLMTDNIFTHFVASFIAVSCPPPQKCIIN